MGLSVKYVPEMAQPAPLSALITSLGSSRGGCAPSVAMSGDSLELGAVVLAAEAVFNQNVFCKSATSQYVLGITSVGVNVFDVGVCLHANDRSVGLCELPHE